MHDDGAPTSDASELISMPVLVGAEAEAFTPQHSARVAMRDPHTDWPKAKRELWDHVAAGHVVPQMKTSHRRNESCGSAWSTDHPP